MKVIVSTGKAETSKTVSESHTTHWEDKRTGFYFETSFASQLLLFCVFFCKPVCSSNNALSHIKEVMCGV